MTQPHSPSLEEESSDELSDEELAESMEKSLVDSADGRLFHKHTLLFMAVTKDSYENAWNSTVEFVKERRKREEAMTDAERNEERRRARERFRKDFGA
jgi:hypothetical protein